MPRMPLEYDEKFATDFDLDLIVKGFLLGALEDQQELVRRLANPFRDSKALRDLVNEVAEESHAKGSLPVQIIGLGLMYGMATGIFIERERATRKEHSFDVNGVVRRFLQREFPERPVMIRMLTGAFRDSETFKSLLIAVCTEVLGARNDRVEGIAIAMRYGMCMGVVLEVDRRRRNTTILGNKLLDSPTLEDQDSRHAS